MNFADRLIEGIKAKGTPLIVGIDPRQEQLPEAFQDDYRRSLEHGHSRWESSARVFERFSTEIIDVVAPLVAAIKPQMAFFEELGPAGMVALANVIDYAQERHVLVILDGKRNDIGTTGQAYANAYLGVKPLSPWGADALTINPWMGFDTLQPFIQVAEKNEAGLFVLVKTSNPGSGDLQELACEGQSNSTRIGVHIEQLNAHHPGTHGFGIVGAVVGATYPEQMASLRTLMPSTLFLIPGFGAQGGRASDVAAGFNNQGLGAVINSSRGIIFAHSQPPFAHIANWQFAVEQATRLAIDQIAQDTPAGKLRT